MSQPYRVFVVDDSALMRRRISTIIDTLPGFQVAGFASNGIECLAQLATMRPDIITLDVEMPELDGLSTLQCIMRERPTPVLMISSLTEVGARTTIEALARGAVDYLAKPALFSTDARHQFGDELTTKLQIAARVRLPRAARVPARPAEPRQVQRMTPLRLFAQPASRRGIPLVVIGSSTGGPQALDQIFDRLGVEARAAFLVVQHMPPVFTRSLAARLAKRTPLLVREAAEEDTVSEHTALVAPGGWHMTVTDTAQIHLDQEPPMHGVRPAIDRTLYAVATHWRGPRLAVILTGMGVDGMEGARALRHQGGEVYAQDESTSVVFGMPRAVIEAGLASAVLPIEQIADAVTEWVRATAPHYAPIG